MTRETAVVRDIFVEPETYVEMMFEFGGEGRCMEYQAFAFYAPDSDWKQAALARICQLFGVQTIDQTRGHRCAVLRAWDQLNEPIEGIEVGDQRFTLSDVCGRSRLERRSSELSIEIDLARRRLTELEDRLARLPNGYVEWGNP